MMSRKDIQEALVARGIDLQEAQIRIDSLTDSEIEEFDRYQVELVIELRQKATAQVSQDGTVLWLDIKSR